MVNIALVQREFSIDQLILHSGPDGPFGAHSVQGASLCPISVPSYMAAVGFEPLTS